MGKKKRAEKLDGYEDIPISLSNLALTEKQTEIQSAWGAP